MRRPPVIGFVIGLTAVVIWYSIPLLGFEFHPPEESLLRDFVVWISTPVAVIVSAISGWKLQQEEAIFIYAFIAIPITIPLLGLLLGFAYAGVKSLIHKQAKK